jgi:hypothetical protein
LHSRDEDVVIGFVIIAVLTIISTFFGAFYATLLLLIPSIYSLYYKDYKSAKLLLILPLAVTLYIWKEQNTYYEEYINNMAYEMDVTCVLDMKDYYKEKGYTLRWISKEENSRREYAMGEQKWALPFLSSVRYDIFDRTRCHHVAEIAENKVKKSLFYIADHANDVLLEEEPETIYFR